MLSDLQRRKWIARFNLLDADKNGYIEKADYDLMIARFAKSFNSLPSSESYQRLVKLYDLNWKALASKADANKDGRVSRDEYLASVEADFMRGGAFERLSVPMGEEFFKMMDVNGDGVVSSDECVRFFVSMGLKESDAKETFRRLDRNGNGELTKAEVFQAAKEFYTGDDPNAPGNWSYGPF